MLGTARYLTLACLEAVILAISGALLMLSRVVCMGGEFVTYG